MYLDSSNGSIEFQRDSLPIFADNAIAFGRTGTRFSNYEHFYLLMNNSGLFFTAVIFMNLLKKFALWDMI